jgi:diphthamide biosynthesis enzyme Dph1/Dph2-like protein
MYTLELDRVVKEIKKGTVNRVLIQLPDGLKPKANEIVERIEKETDAEVYIWLSSCFGGCDIPLGDLLNVDLVVQFGHSVFIKTGEW